MKKQAIPCPGCADTNTKVLSSRVAYGERHSRRHCNACECRWTTTEPNTLATTGALKSRPIRGWTEERRELLKRIYPSNWNHDVLTQINALDGPALTSLAVKSQAGRMNLRKDEAHANQQPPGIVAQNAVTRRAAEVWTIARVALLRNKYPDTLNSETCAQINALDGPAISERMMVRKAGKLKLRKSREFTETHIRRAQQASRVRSGRSPRAPKPTTGVVNFKDRVRPSISLYAVPRPGPRPLPVLLPLKSACRFPLWGDYEAPTHQYCDVPIPLGESWCSECRRVVFNRGGYQTQVAAE